MKLEKHDIQDGQLYLKRNFIHANNIYGLQQLDGLCSRSMHRVSNLAHGQGAKDRSDMPLVRDAAASKGSDP
jgi:hypothetical protein